MAIAYTKESASPSKSNLMNIRKVTNITLCALMTLAISACGGKSQPTDPAKTPAVATDSAAARQALRNRRSTAIARVACDATFENIMQQEIDVFEYRTDYKYPVLPYYVSEAQCLDSLMSGIVDVAVLSRPLTPYEVQRLTERGRKPHTTEIAIDGIAIIVNQDNPLEELTTAQLGDILSGKYLTWKDLGADNLGDIKVIFDNPRSSTSRCLKEKLLADSVAFGPSVGAVSDSLDSRRVFELVAKNPNAIGVIGVSWVTRDLNSVDMTIAQRNDYSDNYEVEPDLNFREEIKVMKIGETAEDAVRPWQAYLFDGTYPLWRSIYMVNTGGNGTGAHSFYVFVTSWIGQKLMQETGILPKVIHTKVVQLN